MITRLRRRFILLSSVSLFALLLIILAAMNAINYQSVVANADRELEILSENHGTFPEFLEEPGMERPDDLPQPTEEWSGEPGPRDKRAGRPERGLLGIFSGNGSAERPYQSRFFSVLLDATGAVKSADVSRIASVDAETATDYAAQVASSGRSRGFLASYRYALTEENECRRVTFLDCSQELTQAKRFLLYGGLVSFAGFLAVFLVLFLASGRIIRPIAEAYEKQKRFITDAGHEIRTPLAIIRANTDVLELDLGENESLDDIRHEIDRLTELTKDLVQLSRMEEEGTGGLPMIEFPLSDVISDAAEPFRTLFAAEGKSLALDVQEGITLKGNESALRQLTSILLDNARKYSPAGTETSLSLTKAGNRVSLTVANPTETEIPAEALNRVFDRFYRTDPSRNSQTGGNGIGLSIAQAIVQSHGGRIRAATTDGHDFRVTAVLGR